MLEKRQWRNEILNVLKIDEKWFVRTAQIRHILEVIVLTLLMLHGVARFFAISSIEFPSDNNLMNLTAIFYTVYITWLEFGIAIFFVFVILILLGKCFKQKSPFQINIRSFAFIVLKLPVVLFLLMGSPKWFFISFLVFGGLRVLLWWWEFWCRKKDGTMAMSYCSGEIESSSNHDLQVK